MESENEVWGVCEGCGLEGKFIGEEGDDWICHICAEDSSDSYSDSEDDEDLCSDCGQYDDMCSCLRCCDCDGKIDDGGDCECAKPSGKTYKLNNDEEIIAKMFR